MNDADLEHSNSSVDAIQPEMVERLHRRQKTAGLVNLQQLPGQRNQATAHTIAQRYWLGDSIIARYTEPGVFQPQVTLSNRSRVETRRYFAPLPLAISEQSIARSYSDKEHSSTNNDGFSAIAPSLASASSTPVETAPTFNSRFQVSRLGHSHSSVNSSKNHSENNSTSNSSTIGFFQTLSIPPHPIAYPSTKQTSSSFVSQSDSKITIPSPLSIPAKSSSIETGLMRVMQSRSGAIAQPKRLSALEPMVTNLSPEQVTLTQPTVSLPELSLAPSKSLSQSDSDDRDERIESVKPMERVVLRSDAASSAQRTTLEPAESLARPPQTSLFLAPSQNGHGSVNSVNLVQRMPQSYVVNSGNHSFSHSGNHSFSRRATDRITPSSDGQDLPPLSLAISPSPPQIARFDGVENQGGANLPVSAIGSRGESAPSQPASDPGLNVQRITDQVSRQIRRQLRVERERRGL